MSLEEKIKNAPRSEFLSDVPKWKVKIILFSARLKLFLKQLKR